MTQEIEKVMVFKTKNELPHYLKYILDFIPEFGGKVVVLAQEMQASTLLLRVAFGKQQQCVLSAIYFRTVRKAQLREKLLTRPVTPAIEQMLKTL